MLRSTNTGISTLITATGEITQATQLDRQEIVNASIPITPPIWTLVKQWGDWFGPFALLFSLVGLDLRFRGLGFGLLIGF
jgi:apolipoprotein N-acyltransferase